jgi:hypothetical protein
MVYIQVTVGVGLTNLSKRSTWKSPRRRLQSKWEDQNETWDACDFGKLMAVALKLCQFPQNLHLSLFYFASVFASLELLNFYVSNGVRDESSGSITDRMGNTMSHHIL